MRPIAPPRLARALTPALLCCALPATAHAQQEPQANWSAEPDEPSASEEDEDARGWSVGGLELMGFVDTYYAFDFDTPADNTRPGFLYNHTRHNEFSLNLAMLHASWQRDIVRANLGLMAGTYPQYNYAYEQPLLRNVFEANAGVRLAPRLWVDAGVFPSHIGFESALSTQNLTLTRSLQAENSPYFLSGVRATWEATESLTVAAVVANGWQNIRETPDNDSKGGGTQVSWSPVETLTLNWSSWVSDESPRDQQALRVFNDFYGVFDLGSVELIAGFDIGAQQRPDQDGASTWYGAALLGKVDLTEHVGVGARVERYSDPDGVIVAVAGGQGVRLTSGSLNLDIEPLPGTMVRLEGRLLHNPDPIFGEGFDGERYNTSVVTSLATSF